ncbi:putative membrane protein YhhN [Flavobacterium sp. 28A]|uniref:lysoplasmalogenase n=1 Tax=Flavobacterium sp. 28A TaxID=2735895 RepID=UPI00156F84F2|nr:lysoplasmalogenase [Flavobacterium sp. 28A]NRT15483.1 putative membrane protein YhhN [Flavobacterium sp. 28A]
MKTNTLLKSYLAFSALYLAILLLELETIAGFMKPVLILLLIAAVYLSASFTSKKLLLIALLCSWIGDIILLFADRGELYFIFGLVAFLISHLVYIFLFNKQLKPKKDHNRAIYWSGVTAIIAYLMIFLSILLPSLGELTIPVFVYALVISTMLLFALKGFLIWQKPASWYVLLGAIVFVSSDSILAFDKFYSPIMYNSFFIMVTYILAQYLIVVGILKLNQKK